MGFKKIGVKWGYSSLILGTLAASISIPIVSSIEYGMRIPDMTFYDGYLFDDELLNWKFTPNGETIPEYGEITVDQANEMIKEIPEEVMLQYVAKTTCENLYNLFCYTTEYLACLNITGFSASIYDFEWNDGYLSYEIECSFPYIKDTVNYQNLKFEYNNIKIEIPKVDYNSEKLSPSISDINLQQAYSYNLLNNWSKLITDMQQNDISKQPITRLASYNGWEKSDAEYVSNWIRSSDSVALHGSSKNYTTPISDQTERLYFLKPGNNDQAKSYIGQDNMMLDLRAFSDYYISKESLLSYCPMPAYSYEALCVDKTLNKDAFNGSEVQINGSTHDGIEIGRVYFNLTPEQDKLYSIENGVESAYNISMSATHCQDHVSTSTLTESEFFQVQIVIDYNYNSNYTDVVDSTLLHPTARIILQKGPGFDTKKLFDGYEDSDYKDGTIKLIIPITFKKNGNEVIDNKINFTTKLRWEDI